MNKYPGSTPFDKTPNPIDDSINSQFGNNSSQQYPDEIETASKLILQFKMAQASELLEHYFADSDFDDINTPKVVELLQICYIGLGEDTKYARLMNNFSVETLVIDNKSIALSDGFYWSHNQKDPLRAYQSFLLYADATQAEHDYVRALFALLNYFIMTNKDTPLTPDQKITLESQFLPDLNGNARGTWFRILETVVELSNQKISKNEYYTKQTEFFGDILNGYHSPKAIVPYIKILKFFYSIPWTKPELDHNEIYDTKNYKNNFLNPQDDFSMRIDSEARAYFKQKSDRSFDALQEKIKNKTLTAQIINKSKNKTTLIDHKFKFFVPIERDDRTEEVDTDKQK